MYSAADQGVHVALRRHDAKAHQLAISGVAEVVAHPGGDVDPSAELQRHPLLVNEEVALALDAHEPVGPGVGVDAALRTGLQGEQPHHIVVPEAAFRAENDFFRGIFNKMTAGHHRQVPDVAGIFAHGKLLLDQITNSIQASAGKCKVVRRRFLPPDRSGKARENTILL